MEFLIGAALVGGLLVVSVSLLLTLLLKAAFWAVTLPVRLVFRLLFFPFWLARMALRMAGLVILAPIVAVGGVLLTGVVIIGGLIAVLAPLLPLLVITLLVWLVVRRVSQPALPVS